MVKRSVQHVGIWGGVLALHALALAWLTQNHSVAPALPEVTWIEWATPEAVPIAPHMSKLASSTRLAAPPLTAQPQTPPRTMPALAQEPATAPNPAAPSVSPGAALTNDAGSTMQAGSGAGVTSAARPATEEVTLPSQSAAYLNNPPPAYPAISKRLGEQGRVVVRVLIDENGLPQQAELQTSSGHARLDQAALNAVMSWHYVPGRKAGRAQAMWFNVPITFDLKPARDG
jgi:protein TonB